MERSINIPSLARGSVENVQTTSACDWKDLRMLEIDSSRETISQKFSAGPRVTSAEVDANERETIQFSRRFKRAKHTSNLSGIHADRRINTIVGSINLPEVFNL